MEGCRQASQDLPEKQPPCGGSGCRDKPRQPTVNNEVTTNRITSGSCMSYLLTDGRPGDPRAETRAVQRGSVS